MTRDTFDLLFSEKKGPCLSIIMPMHKLSRERMQNPEILRKAIRKAKMVLKRKAYPPNISVPITEKLDALTKAFKPELALHGLGLFVSPHHSQAIHFPFPVKEKVILDYSFETRDLHYLKQLLKPYFVLALGKKNTRLYSAQGEQFIEIKDGHFPMEYEDEYEYEQASRGSSFGYARKGFEKDKSVVTKNRIQSFFKECGSHLTSYLNKSNAPLIIAGTKPMLTEFKSLSTVENVISGEVIGSFKPEKFFDLKIKAMMSVTKLQKEEVKNKIREFKERDRLGHMSKGIQEVWQAAHEGRGMMLLVEKDYTRMSYLRDGDPVLHLFPPKGKYTIVPDAVDEIIETVIEKGGNVTFTEEGKLKSFNEIALLLRY